MLLVRHVEGNDWTTPGFAEAEHKLTVELKTNVAGFEVEWVD